MSVRARAAIAPLYLMCCLLLGSAQNSWALMVLELLGLALLAWAALEPAGEPLGRAARHLLVIAGVALTVIALQLVPLPVSLWQHLGGRQGLATDFRMLGLRISALPLSLSPNDTLDDVLRLIPPLAIVCAIVRLRAYRPSWLAAALLAGTAASIVLRVTHVPNSDHPIFSTSILPAMPLPFAVALFVSERGAWRQQKALMIGILAITALIILAGLTMDHSLAGFGLALSVFVASLLLLVETGWHRSGVRAGVLLGAAVAFVSMATIHPQDRGHVVGPSVEGRAEVRRTAVHATGDFMPFGSGLGSFQNVYRLYEDPDRVTAENVVHAHDEYLELALELGLPGILLLVGFLAWWKVASVYVWREADAALFARAASIASALVLIDSLVASPLRDPEIMIVFAMCLALLVDRQAATVRSRSELWPSRHIVLK